ncbi:dihydrofolate reductase family protein [Actinomadura fulvescens]|uniref:Dihydrofolate reductase family protein n=1 Tax=Actinomadura fulvescens TaxID=46160 RepID=A0ABN3PW42_9ACTN
MRKIVMYNRVTLDGFYARPNGDIDWFINDPMVDRASHEMMSPDTILFGRVTYQQFESFWPAVAKNPEAPEGARMIAGELNKMTKVVFSTTLKEVTWENSQLIGGNVAKEVEKLKQGDGPDIVIFGSGTIAQELARAGLIDEYLIALTPVVLGEGKPMFEGVGHQDLKLLDSRTFESGNTMLRYAVG